MHYQPTSSTHGAAILLSVVYKLQQGFVITGHEPYCGTTNCSSPLTRDRSKLPHDAAQNMVKATLLANKTPIQPM